MPPNPIRPGSSKPQVGGSCFSIQRRERAGPNVLLLERESKGFLIWDLQSTRGPGCQETEGLLTEHMAGFFLEVQLEKGSSEPSWLKSRRLWRRFWRSKRPRKNKLQRARKERSKSFFESIFEQERDFVLIMTMKYGMEMVRYLNVFP